MNLLLHHFRKDLRILLHWPLFLLLGEATGVIFWYTSLPPEGRADHVAVLPFWHYSIWALCFFLSGGLVQRDAPLREGAFFRTKPVALSTMLQAKALTVVTLLLPFALIHSLSLLLFGLRPGALDLLLVFAEETLMLTALAAVGMAMAIRQESPGKFFSSVVLWGGVVLVAWIAFSWGRHAYFQNEKPDWSYDLEYLKSSRMLMAWLVALAGPVTGIVLFARSGRRETLDTALPLTALLTVATLLFWPLNFVKAFAPTQRDARKSEWPDQARLKFTFKEQPNGRDGTSMFTFVDGGYNGTRYRRIDAFGSLTGLSGGWEAAYPNSYQSKLTLTNGKSFFKSSKAWAGLNWQFILPQLGIPSSYTKDDKQVRQFELSEFKLEDTADAMTDAKLSGTMQIHLKRPVILARIPLRKGASTVIDGRLITITDVMIAGNEIRFNFVTQTHMVHLQGGWQKIWTNRFNYVVIHAERREFLDNPGAGGSNLRSGHYSVQKQEISGKLREHFKEKPIPPDWLDGAELIITGDENGSSFPQAFDFKNLNLSNNR